MLLGAFAVDGASRAALSLLPGCAPLAALLAIYSAADALPGAGGGGGAFDPVATREALARAQSIEESRAAIAAAARRVLSPAAVAARRAALAAFAVLAAEPALLRAEAYRRNKKARFGFDLRANTAPNPDFFLLFRYSGGVGAHAAAGAAGGSAA